MINMLCALPCFETVVTPHVGKTTKTDPAFIQQITEGRWTPGSDYAWCGDWVTWVLMMMGSADSHLNRVAINGRWQIGRNLAMLIDAARGSPQSIKGGKLTWRRGDLVIFDRPKGNHIGFMWDPLPGDPRPHAFVSCCGNTYPGGAISYVKRDEKPIMVFDVSCLNYGRGPSSEALPQTADKASDTKDGYDIG